MSKVLMKGNEAIAEAAIRAGCLNYFAYPITPQTEVAEYLSKRMSEVDGLFLQGESEVAVSYMIFGASACGERVFTTSSSPGVSLMSEGISYITAAECPAVFVNIMRGGPDCWLWHRPVSRKRLKWSWKPFPWQRNIVTR